MGHSHFTHNLEHVFRFIAGTIIVTVVFIIGYYVFNNDPNSQPLNKHSVTTTIRQSPTSNNANNQQYEKAFTAQQLRWKSLNKQAMDIGNQYIIQGNKVDWKAELQKFLQQEKQLANQAKALMPPEKYAKLHARYLAAIDQMNRATNVLPTILNNRDVKALRDCINNIMQARASLNSINNQFQGMQ